MNESDKNKAAPIGFKEAERGGFKLRWLDDGLDYPAVWDDFRSGRLAGECLTCRPDRETHLVETGGRKYILKKAGAEKARRWAWDLVAGSAFDRLMKKSWAARARGCDLIPQFYLTAEKIGDYRRCPESYILAQYLEGEVLPPEPEARPLWLMRLAEALPRLHGFGLASGDPRPENLVVTPDGVKVIDIFFKGPMLVCQAHDLLDCRKKYGLIIPPATRALKLVYALVSLKYKWHLWRRKIRGIEG